MEVRQLRKRSFRPQQEEPRQKKTSRPIGDTSRNKGRPRVNDDDMSARTKRRRAATPRKRGRPQMQFTESSARTKLRKTENIRESNIDVLMSALKTKLRLEGRFPEASLIAECEKPGQATRILQVWKSSQKDEQNGNFSGDEALTFLVENNLTKEQYNHTRAATRAKASKLFPSYHKISAAKQLCYPESIEVTEAKAEIPLQKLVDHTVHRLVAAQESVIACLTSSQRSSLKCLYKWGMDGSSSHSQYKQKSESDDFEDKAIFLVSMVPLQLYYDDGSTTIIVWRNPVPGSPGYCRPIRLLFSKETTELTREQSTDINNQINSLVATHVEEKDISCNHIFYYTMVDGKVCNTLEGAHSSNCYLCEAKPSEMNSEEIFARPTNEAAYQYGLSSLHAKIKFMEFFLNISKRLPVKKYKPRGDERIIIEENEKRILRILRNELGLRLNEPRAGGSGTSNDGNSARRFFEEHETVARILDLDPTLLAKCNILLIALSSGFPLDCDKLSLLCRDIFNILMDKYKWYYMSPTVHKILVHGPSVVQSFMVPIGMMSEEAQEARNKHIRNYREHYSRKDTRIHNMQDMFLRLLVTSDPIIASLRQKRSSHQHKQLPSGVLELLTSEVPMDDHSDDEE